MDENDMPDNLLRSLFLYWSALWFQTKERQAFAVHLSSSNSVDLISSFIPRFVGVCALSGVIATCNTSAGLFVPRLSLFVNWTRCDLARKSTIFKPKLRITTNSFLFGEIA